MNKLWLLLAAWIILPLVSSIIILWIIRRPKKGCGD